MRKTPANLYSLSMATSTTALVTPDVLEWARRESGYAPEPVAKRLNVKPEHVLAWEKGERKPTVRQAQDLARFYHRPFGVFFLPQPPALRPLASEYRRLPGVKPGAESPAFRIAVRVMLQRSEVALDLAEELGLPVAEFDFTAHLSENPIEVGARLRAALGVTADEQFDWTSEWQAWRIWREAAESVGALVFQFSKVSLELARGIAFFDFPLPSIGINSKESSPAARSFMLMHELTHIALALGKDELAALDETRGNAEWQDVERFAEEAASFALIPADILSVVLSKMNVEPDTWNIPLMRSLASKFRVTPLAMATRLRAIGQLTWAGYNEWKEAWNKYLSALPTRKGFASPVDKTLGRSGRPFVKLVLEALDTNKITAANASRYLDLKFDHFEKLRNAMRIGHIMPTGGFDDGD